MSAPIIQFPKGFRHTLPPDAIPRGRERHVYVFPSRGAWAWQECDEDGGSLVDNLTKSEAIDQAMEWVAKYNATLSIHNNTSIIEDER